jgi:hypothetical protein
MSVQPPDVKELVLRPAIRRAQLYEEAAELFGSLSA